MFRAIRNTRTATKVFGGLTLAGFTQITLQQLYQPVYLDDLINAVVVDKGISPFPKLIGAYKMLGSGVRSVTFVGFKVYGVGIYYNKSEELALKKILRQNVAKDGDAGESLKQQLGDDEKSVALLDQLITNHEFLVRISPVRNTDFNHLKDGFIKSILAHPLTEDLERVNQGLDQLRQAFKGFKGSVPKNHVLVLAVNKQGHLLFKYENPTTKQVTEMGVVTEPIISKLLLIGYLGHKKPLSGPLRDSCNEKWMELVGA